MTSSHGFYCRLLEGPRSTGLELRSEGFHESFGALTSRGLQAASLFGLGSSDTEI